VILKKFKNPEQKVLSFLTVKEPRTEGSFILIVKEPRTEGSFILTVKEPRTEGSLIFNSLKTQNTILHKIKRTAQQWFLPVYKFLYSYEEHLIPTLKNKVELSQFWFQT
jgi:hypothetical protein